MLEVDPDVLERGRGSFEAIANGDPGYSLSRSQLKMRV